jgi:integrase
MAARRSRGDGGLYWDRRRGRWIAAITVGYAPSGKRIVRRASGTSKTAAQRKLKEIIRDYEDGLTISPGGYTIAQAVRDWLAHGLSGRSQETITTCTILSNTHIIPALGARKLKDLRAEDVDKWLAAKSQTLSTATLHRLHSCLNRATKRAMARDKVRRNVVDLCTVPTGQPGRPSKALTMAEAEAVLQAAERSRMHAYIVVSLLTGARTEELRALTWDHVDLDGEPDGRLPVPPHVAVWRSVRAGGDTKTGRSRRTLALPKRCVDALRDLRDRQDQEREAAGTSNA